MIKKIKPIVVFLMLFLFLQGVNCQNPVNIPDYLSQKFTKYCKTVPREEIYIHSDREEYLSGEALWFNVYLIDRQSFKPSENSKIAYFELLNSENRPVVQKRILLDGGFGPGQIIIPDTLSTGIYTIRAYTSWMKNFLPINCFMKDIRIYNAFSSKTIKRKVPASIIKGTDDLKNNDSGLTLTVNNLNENFMEIFINSDENFRSANFNLCYLFIETHGTINYVRVESIREEITKIVIDKKLLSQGINHVTVFNYKGQPVSEKLVYTPGKDIPFIKVNSNDSLGMRKKVSLDLTTGIVGGLENLQNLSISVGPVAKGNFVQDINDYLVFGTEFGYLPPNVLKNKKLNELPVTVIDSLLQTVRSNWINWNSILSDDLPVFKYHFEKDEHYIFGKLVNSDPKQQDSSKFVILSTPGKVAVFQYARTDQKGNFSFKIPISQEKKDLVLQPDGITKNQTINIESSYSDQYTRSGKSSASFEPVPPYISTWSINHQVRKIYGISSEGKSIPTIVSDLKFRRFYGKPTNELLMKDYIALPVMQEVFFELLAGVSLKSKKSGYEITMNDPANSKPYDYPPSLFVDGVMVKDAAVIAGIDPEVVEKIDVVRDRYFVGDYLFYGIVNVITKAGDFSNATLPDHALRIIYRVIDPIPLFISPDYNSSETKATRLPDFRTTLYWNPSVKQDKEGKSSVEFWTSDFSSDYEVNIQGITSEGMPFSFKKTIKVKR